MSSHGAVSAGSNPRSLSKVRARTSTPGAVTAKTSLRQSVWPWSISPGSTLVRIQCECVSERPRSTSREAGRSTSSSARCFVPARPTVGSASRARSSSSRHVRFGAAAASRIHNHDSAPRLRLRRRPVPLVPYSSLVSSLSLSGTRAVCVAVFSSRRSSRSRSMSFARRPRAPLVRYTRFSHSRSRVEWTVDWGVSSWRVGSDGSSASVAPSSSWRTAPPKAGLSSVKLRGALSFSPAASETSSRGESGELAPSCVSEAREDLRSGRASRACFASSREPTRSSTMSGRLASAGVTRSRSIRPSSRADSAKLRNSFGADSGTAATTQESGADCARTISRVRARSPISWLAETRMSAETSRSVTGRNHQSVTND